ncbi:MAG: hypothetical protein IEMM0008_0995 [bacterium]|nr:MAG: hypothetical protein IEMM0008_0995 [bacterium]
MSLRFQFKEWAIRSITKIAEKVINYSMISRIRRVAVIFALLFFFLFVILVYAHESAWITVSWPSKIPSDFFFAVYIAFTFILFYEVLSMIFVLTNSIADSIGKQYEIMSLIILRTVFEHVGDFQKDIESLTSRFTNTQGLDMAQGALHNWKSVEELLAGCFGSLILFFLVRVYYTLQKHSRILDDPNDYRGFVAVKRFLSLSLIVVLFFLGISEVIHLCQSFFSHGIQDISISHIFFKDMFSIMIFVDILLVLLTTRYSSDYHVVFRNSGLTISTVVLRMSFSSSIMVSVIMAILAVLIGIGITLVYNQFHKDKKPKDVL